MNNAILSPTPNPKSFYALFTGCGCISASFSQTEDPDAIKPHLATLMDYSTLQPFLFFAVFLVSQSINDTAFTKLTQEQQQAAGSVQSVLPKLMIPLFVVVSLVIWFMDKIESIAWIYALAGLSWAVPLLIIFAWENRRLRAKQLPANYLKARIHSQSALVGGCLLFLFWR